MTDPRLLAVALFACASASAEAPAPELAVRTGVVLDATLAEAMYLFTDSQGVVVAEAAKADVERFIALAPGKYSVARSLKGKASSGRFVVHDRQSARILEATFVAPIEPSVPHKPNARHWGVAASGQYQLMFDRPTNAGGYFPSAPLVGIEASLHNLWKPGLSLALDGEYGWATGTVSSGLVLNTPFRYSSFELGLTGAYEFGAQNRFVPFVGARVALHFLSREFTGLTNIPKQTFTVLSPGVVVGLKFRVVKGFSAIARGRLHYLLYNVDETRSLGYTELGVLIQYEFKE